MPAGGIRTSPIQCCTAGKTPAGRPASARAAVISACRRGPSASSPPTTRAAAVMSASVTSRDSRSQSARCSARTAAVNTRWSRRLSMWMVERIAQACTTRPSCSIAVSVDRSKPTSRDQSPR
ncbi:hypothetical protein WY02_06830 [Pseudonocardia sp. AL041005-10]|nr:hypothetical protein WY02_06830 [Pseudonocardia sp. AL041005-10]